ncbi:MAG: hypothetical protein M1816_006899 [Peltula sp. TS41687]|nr:MAG: hypothetical protein M1816_006899 [Peltula sp. TS41687]
MDRIKETTNAILLDPRNAALLSIIKAARNGAVYGAKVRFPHALVMVFLFRHGPVRDKLLLILRATRQHARNLGLYAALYKATLYLLRTTRSPPQKELRYDTFVAGLLGGYVVFGRGRQSSVNQQITIYVFARVVLGEGERRGGEAGVAALCEPELGGGHVFVSLGRGDAPAEFEE